MKQFISLQQYQELNEEERIRWSWIILRHMIEHFDKKEIRYVDYEDIHRHTTIGQMIEYLGDKWFEEIRFSGDPEGLVMLDDSFDDIYYMGNKGLCDALWEAVKEVLKTQK